jgi:hypothetical protein
MKVALGSVVSVVGLFVVMVGISGCVLFLTALLPRQPPPLPELTVVPPGPEVPQELAAFTGGWRAWQNKKSGLELAWVVHILVVEKIVSAEDVTVVFAIGGGPGHARSERVKARFDGNKLLLRSGGWKAVYAVQNDRLSTDLSFSFRSTQVTLYRAEVGALNDDVNTPKQ